jgi:hypothetical protein
MKTSQDPPRIRKALDGIPARRAINLTSKLILMLLLGAALAFMATGCASTFKDVKPLGGGAPPPKDKPSALALGDLKITDDRLTDQQRKIMAHAFRLGVEKWCAEHKSLDVVEEMNPTNVPPTALMLRGTITEVEKGSAAARFWVGMGAGQERTQGEFSLHSSDGTKLTTFIARKSYLGGSGIGGWDMLKLEDLLDQLGQLVAETTDKWLRGEKLD